MRDLASKLIVVETGSTDATPCIAASYGAEVIPCDFTVVARNLAIAHEIERVVALRKNHLYIEILKEEIAADPSDDSRLDFLAAEYHQLECSMKPPKSPNASYA